MTELRNETIWFDQRKFEEAESQYQRSLVQKEGHASLPRSSIVDQIAKARETIKQTLEQERGRSDEFCTSDDGQRLSSLEKENQQLKKVIENIQASLCKLEETAIADIEISKGSGAPANSTKVEAEITDENLLNQLEKFRKATCLIEADDFKSTGFHFGRGWIISVAHAFQNDDVDTSQFHSLLSRAKFTFHVDDENIEFPSPSSTGSEENRVAIIHHIQPGHDMDAQNMDIAVVKLGVQYEYGRVKSEYEDWEKDEQKKLKGMELGSVFAKIEERKVVAGDKVYAIFSSGENDWKKIEQTVKAVKSDQPIPTVVLKPPAGHRASGCPILNKDHMLVGLLLGGDDARSAHGEDDALMWNGGIEKYVTNCVPIIAFIGSYMYALKKLAIDCTDEEMALRASRERGVLEKLANDNDLTIYLTNGENVTVNTC